MPRSLCRAAAVLAAASTVALASSASAEDCVKVAGDRILCADADAEPTVDTAGGITVSAVVGVDVCSPLVPSAPTCTPDSATAGVGPTGVTGVWLSSGPAGGNVVRVPKICLGTTCAGPYEYPLPTVTAPCVGVEVPRIVVDGRGMPTIKWLDPSGTCPS